MPHAGKPSKYYPEAIKQFNKISTNQKPNINVKSVRKTVKTSS
jgi:hypothetical protein